MTGSVEHELKKSYEDFLARYTNTPEEVLIGLITPFNHAKITVSVIRRPVMIEHNVLQEQDNTKQILCARATSRHLQGTSLSNVKVVTMTVKVTDISKTENHDPLTRGECVTTNPSFLFSNKRDTVVLDTAGDFQLVCMYICICFSSCVYIYV